MLYTGGLYTDKDENDTPLNNYKRCPAPPGEESEDDELRREFTESENRLNCLIENGLASVDKRVYIASEARRCYSLRSQLL